MAILVIIFVTVFVFVVVKGLISEAKPIKKTLNTETAEEEKLVPKDKKKAEPQKAKPATKKTKKSKFEYKTYRVPGGYGYLLGGVGGGGAGNYSKQDDEFDEAEYRAYREELAAYDDFVASLDMDD